MAVTAGMYSAQSAVTAEIAKADWPFQVAVYFGHAQLTRALVQELVAANWPALTFVIC